MEELPKILSGDGESPETAVKFEPSVVSRRVAAEREFVCSKFGTENMHWTEEMHYTSMQMQSVWIIKTNEGDRREVYFETEGTIYE